MLTMWATWAGVVSGLGLVLIGANREATPVTAPTTLLTRPERGIGDTVAAATVVSVYVLLLLIIDRFWTTTAIGLVLIVLLWAGNRLKVAILNEVLVFSDIFLAGHALRYPRLYFGYAPKWIWPVLMAGVGVLGWSLTIEAPMNVFTGLERLGLISLWAVMFGLMACKMARPSEGIKAFLSKHPLSFDTQTDAWAYTPLGAVLLHVLWHGQRRHVIRERFAIKADMTAGMAEETGDAGMKEGEGSKGHHLLIQAESFVPVGELLGRPSRTPEIDDLMRRTTSGRLELDWRGAYTMRTEFAVLTGHAPRELETYGFDPYRLAAMIPMKSLARTFKTKGWRTVVCHPNDARFFERDKVMCHLGFDEFIDLADLQARWPHLKDKSSLCGHYVSDEALMAWAADYLKEVKEPTFLFIITMEAHGPWDAAKFEGANMLTEVERYEVHLAHLDSGLAKVKRAQAGGLPLSVLMYGDHLPGLDVLRACTANIPADTRWVMWNEREVNLMTIGPEEGKSSSLKPEHLGEAWLAKEARAGCV